MSYVCYVLSISFQFAGSILLLLNCFSTKRENVIRRFASCTMISKDNDTGKLEYKKEAFLETYKEAYLNKIALILVVAGYSLNLFSGADGHSKRITFFIVIALVGLFIFMTKLITRYIIKYSKKVNRVMTNEELLKLGIKPDIENISEAEIKKMLED